MSNFKSTTRLNGLSKCMILYRGKKLQLVESYSSFLKEIKKRANSKLSMTHNEPFEAGELLAAEPWFLRHRAPCRLTSWVYYAGNKAVLKKIE